jgi:hypothetical protein
MHNLIFKPELSESTVRAGAAQETGHPLRLIRLERNPSTRTPAVSQTPPSNTDSMLMMA